MTYQQLLDYLDKMSEEQLGHSVIIMSIDGGLYEPSSILVVAHDYAENSKDEEDWVKWADGQVVLV